MKTRLILAGLASLVLTFTASAVPFDDGAMRMASKKSAAAAKGSVFSPLLAGDLDPAFDLDGKVTTSFGGAEDVGVAVVVQPDGKILSAGYSGTGINSSALVVRYNADGSLDNSFAGDGKVTESFSLGFAAATSIALQQDGKIVVAGYARGLPNTGFDFFVLRYNADGTLDTTFDTDGKVLTDFSSFDEAGSLVIQPDGKLIVAGYATSTVGAGTNATLARYNTDGSLDTSFDTDGKITSFEGAAFSVVVQQDGKIVTAGWGCPTAATCGQNFDFAFLRFNADGTADITFDTDGKATVAVSANRDEGREIALQPDGKIVAIGAIMPAADGDRPALVRLNANGSVDTTFGTGGIVQNLPATVESAFSLSLQANGKIVAGARIYPGTTDSDFALLRFTTAGALDTAFSEDGIAPATFADKLDGILDIAIQADGKVVAAGFSEGSTGDIDVAMARFISQSPVTITGRVTQPSGSTLRNAIVSLIDSQGITRTALTSAFGIYTFDAVAPGQTYTMTVTSKRYRFTLINVPVGENSLTGVDFQGSD